MPKWLTSVVGTYLHSVFDSVLLSFQIEGSDRTQTW